MITVTRHGNLGPMEAFELRNELEGLTTGTHCDVLLDLSAVDTLHPAAVAAIVSGAGCARRGSGRLRMIEPSDARAQRTLSLVSIATLLR